MGYRRRLMFITILVTLIICAGMVAQFHFGNIQTAEAASLYWGSTGNKVSEVQRKLKQWGYYDGPIDGILVRLHIMLLFFFQRNMV